MLKRFNTFKADEDGAVTVDWVVLTAAVVGLGIAVLTSVTSGTQGVTETVSGHLDGIEIDTTFGGAGGDSDG
ncbi:hypothetical protein PARPLA_01716 [Rhodobacteraceae bacterium THAF1]|uniref:Flp family type IVb pilin n=1 Tax=Palleronia sp. THAF1 TaxID=2587842 RepID=UPI000F400663|nr:hypothetical protein [Palleronia sp. THAF1]QFU09147.1 hypothetical protein FIU81_10725 [Palleronia sp. THAF1]VDC24045.1 hypothetical protein PARPLA_01716 [Rhodobacteraceae bacterium THAF1]